MIFFWLLPWAVIGLVALGCIFFGTTRKRLENREDGSNLAPPHSPKR